MSDELKSVPDAFKQHIIQYIINADATCRVKIVRSSTGGKTGLEVSKSGDNLDDLTAEVRAAFDELADAYGKETPNI